MKNIFTVTILLIGFLVTAQNDYKRGYYITTTGKKTEGFIKSSDFRLMNDVNFTGLEFKESLDQEAEKIEKNTLKEFGSGKEVKIQKVRALIDNVNFYKDYSNEKAFAVEEQTVFLTVLIEGKATLFSYDGGQGVKYLWKREDQGEIAKQLLYKKYYKSNMSLTENTTFREQLFNNVKCPNQEFTEFLKVKYEKDELITIFKKYNKCVGSPITIYEDENVEKAVIKFSAMVGYNRGNLRVKNTRNPTEPENLSLISAGFEGEIIFASRKASVFGSVEMKKGKGSTEKTFVNSEFSTTSLRQVYTFDTYFLDIVMGARFYKKLTAKTTMFAGGGIGLNIGSDFVNFYQSNSIDNKLELLNQYDIAGNGFFTLHVGCQFGKNWGIDVNYDSPKNLINNAIGTSALMQELGLNLRYKF